MLWPVIDRRSFLAAAAGLAGTGIAIGPAHAADHAVLAQTALGSGQSRPRVVEQPPILPRSWWSDGNGPTGPIPAEEPRFLLVHHTAQPGNDYGQDDVARLLRSIYWFHTGAEKQWPDTAYNFFVDRFGRIIEAREGSIAGPVQGSATGGNQGFSQLCCFLGNHSTEPPTQEARFAMVWLLAWLADRYAIDLDPSARVSFTSRGSSRWPAGTVVETSTIAGHRDMSQTTCPGDACYPLVRSEFAPTSATVIQDGGPGGEAAASEAGETEPALPATAPSATTSSVASTEPSVPTESENGAPTTSLASSTSSTTATPTTAVPTSLEDSITAAPSSAPSVSTSSADGAGSPAPSGADDLAIGGPVTGQEASPISGVLVAAGVVAVSAAALVALRTRRDGDESSEQPA